MHRFHKTLQLQKGFTLIELVMVLALFSIMLPALLMYVKDSNTIMTQKAAAGFMTQLGKASEEYILDYYDSLTAAATDTVAVNVLIADLVAGNYLPATFKVTNPWAQDYKVYVLEPAINHLMLLVLSENGKGYDPNRPEFAMKTIPKTASLIGAEGGYVPAGVLATEPDTILQGAFGGWSFAFAGTNVPNPGAGHLAYYKYFADGAATDEYLYRNAVPGRPDLNRMNTTLDMDGHTILMGDGDVGGGDNEGVARINFEEHTEGDFPCSPGDDDGGALYFDDDQGLFLCRQGSLVRINDTGNTGSFQVSMIVADGMTINKPSCPTSLPNPQVFFAPAMASENNSVRPLQAIQTWAVDNGPSWTAKIRVMSNGTWMNPNTTYGRMMAVVTCGP